MDRRTSYIHAALSVAITGSIVFAGCKAGSLGQQTDTKSAPPITGTNLNVVPLLSLPTIDCEKADAAAAAENAAGSSDTGAALPTCYAIAKVNQQSTKFYLNAGQNAGNIDRMEYLPECNGLERSRCNFVIFGPSLDRYYPGHETFTCDVTTKQCTDNAPKPVTTSQNQNASQQNAAAGNPAQNGTSTTAMLLAVNTMGPECFSSPSFYGTIKDPSNGSTQQVSQFKNCLATVRLNGKVKQFTRFSHNVSGVDTMSWMSECANLFLSSNDLPHGLPSGCTLSLQGPSLQLLGPNARELRCTPQGCQAY